MIAVDFHTMPYSMQLTEQIPNDTPRMGAKSTTTILAIIPVLLLIVIIYYKLERYYKLGRNRGPLGHFTLTVCAHFKSYRPCHN